MNQRIRFMEMWMKMCYTLVQAISVPVGKHELSCYVTLFWTLETYRIVRYEWQRIPRLEIHGDCVNSENMKSFSVEEGAKEKRNSKTFTQEFLAKIRMVEEISGGILRRGSWRLESVEWKCLSKAWLSLYLCSWLEFSWSWNREKDVLLRGFISAVARCAFYGWGRQWHHLNIFVN